ncbi:MAG: FAD/NAD(P)-binding protein [Proteobacteria bacterium]|nr:FAD/NAD(P)-binding protein [Pseudomonadota bacterium]
MKRRRIAIVGAGFSGAAVAAQILKRRRAPDVVLIERGRRFGPGLAYGGPERAHLLNVRAANMSVFPDQPDDFVRWLNRRQRRDHATLFAPRPHYGAYLEDVLDRAARRAWGRLKRVRGVAIACRMVEPGWVVELEGGGTIEADAVVLATGNAASVMPSVFESGGVAVLDAWNPEAVRRMRRGESALMIGVGLTMIDLALTLSRDARAGPIYALSRRGLLPRAHLQDPAPAAVTTLALPSDLSEALHVFRREVRLMAEKGEPWQHAVDRLRAQTPDLWRRLTLEQQERFLRHLRPWWDVHRHRFAPEIAARVAELQASGRLRILSGEIVSAKRGSRGGFELQHRQRGSLVRHRMEVQRVINCTGSSRDVTNSADSLMRQLLDDGLARAHANGLGLDTDGDCRVISASGEPHATMVTLGPLTQGVFWESTAVPEIRVRAALLADLLCG